MQTHILVIEDEPAIQELIRFTLEQEGYHVTLTSTAEQAQTLMREILPDVVLIDWMLPGQPGLKLAQQLRRQERTRHLPLIMVTARGDEHDRVTGLESGVDDYITKPFSTRELVARIRAVLRRVSPEHSGDCVDINGVKLDPVRHEVTVDGLEITLGPTEFNLLQFFLSHPERVFTRSQILNAVWGDHRFVEDRTVDVYIRRLRAAIGERGESLIETVRGMGYKLRSRPERTRL